MAISKINGASHNVQYSFAKSYDEQVKTNQSHIGDNGTRVDSKTIYNGKDGSRIDVENQIGRDGQIHYQEKGSKDKWIYDIKNNEFRAERKNGKIGEPAPKRIQKKLDDPLIKKAIEKGRGYLNE